MSIFLSNNIISSSPQYSSSYIKLLGKEITVNFAAADEYYHTSLLNQEDNTAEAATGVFTSKTSPSNKRPFNHEEADNDLHDSKKKKIEISNTNSPPKLLKKFTFYKNKEWGSTWKRYFDDKSNLENTELKMKMKKKRIRSQITQKALPEKYKEKVISMGGSEPVLVIEKMIYTSDVINQCNRFSIPFRQIVTKDFLKEKEKVALLKKEKFWVTMMDPSYREWELTMRQWNMNSDVYVLNSSKWQEIVNTNHLKPGMIVQLWSFYISTKLCFVLVKLHDDSHSD